MTAREDGVIGQRHNFPTVVVKLLREMRRAASHRAREHRVADDRDRPAESGNIEGRSAR